MNDASGRTHADRRTRVELFLPGGRRFTLTWRGKGLDLLKASSAHR
ncbi:MAG: hypothetical protein K0R68_3668 [Mycobacterium sp.]|nr:hypothetical protein [Mycobacterium sp.]